MNALQWGFLAARVLSVILFGWTVTYMGSLPMMMQVARDTSSVNVDPYGPPRLPEGIRIAFVLLPLLVTALLSVALWFRAESFGRALSRFNDSSETGPSDSVKVQTSTSVSALAFRVLGTYFVVLAIPQIFDYVRMYVTADNTFLEFMNPENAWGAGSTFVQVLVGVCLIVGFRRMWRSGPQPANSPSVETEVGSK